MFNTGMSSSSTGIEKTEEGTFLVVSHQRCNGDDHFITYSVSECPTEESAEVTARCFEQHLNDIAESVNNKQGYFPLWGSRTS